MMAGIGNSQLAGGKFEEYIGGLGRKSGKNDLPCNGLQYSNPNFSVSKNMTSPVKQLNNDDFPRGKPQKTPPKPRHDRPMDWAGSVKLNLTADKCRQLIHLSDTDTKSINIQKPPCATQEAHLAMGQNCVPVTRSFSDILKQNTGGADSKPAHQPIPSVSRYTVLGRTGQSMTRGTQQSDKSQHQTPAKTDMQQFLDPHHFTSFCKSTTEKGNVTQEEGKIGEISGSFPRMLWDGHKDLQCFNPNSRVSKNMTISKRQLNYDDFTRGKPQKTIPNPKHDKSMGCAVPLKPSPAADECRQLIQLPQSYSTSIDSLDCFSPVKLNLAEDECRQVIQLPQSYSTSIDSLDCFSPVKLNLADGECRQLSHSDSKSCAGTLELNPRASEFHGQDQIPHPDSTSSHSKKPPCATNEAHLTMSETYTSEDMNYAHVSSDTRSKPTHGRRPIPSISFDPVLEHKGQEMTHGTQMQQCDRPATTTTQQCLEIPQSPLISQTMTEKGNAEQAVGIIGEDSGFPPRKESDRPRDRHTKLPYTNRNLSASKNTTSAVKPLIRYSFARGKPRQTLHKPVGSADPVKPDPAEEECRKLKELLLSDSMIIDSKGSAGPVNPDPTVDECRRPGQMQHLDSESINNKRCTGPVKLNSPTDECRRLGQLQHLDSESINKKGCAGPVKPNSPTDEYWPIGHLQHLDSESINNKRCAGPVKPNSPTDECWPLGHLPQSGSNSFDSHGGECPVKPHRCVDECRQLRQLLLPVSKSIHSQGGVVPVKPSSRAIGCQRQSKISLPDSTNSNCDKPPYATKETHLAMGQTYTSIKKSYADVLTGAGSKPALVPRPVSSDSLDAAFGHTDQEMAIGTQIQSSDIRWPPLVNNHIDHNNTDNESCHDGEHSGYSSLDSDDEGYDDTPDHMASDTDNDPWGPRIRSLGRLIPEAYFDWPFGYSITHLLYMESLGLNYLEPVTGCDTTNVDTRPVQQHHLLQGPDTTDLWTWFVNEWRPSEPVTYEQYFYLTSMSEWLQQQESAAYMYPPYGQMEAPVPTDIYPEVDIEGASQIQTATTSCDSSVCSELCCLSDTT